MSQDHPVNEAFKSSQAAEGEEFLSKSLLISPRRESYDGFFDHDWARLIGRKAKGSILEQAVFEIATSWKAASNARRLPLLAVQLVKSGIEGVVNTRTPMPLEAIRGLCDWIQRGGGRRPDGKRRLRLPKDARQEIVKQIRTIEDRVQEADLNIQIPEDTIWNSLIENPEMQLSLWASEQNAFCAVYFGYESFMIRTMKLLTERESLRTNQLESTLTGKFNRDTAKYLWKNMDRHLAEMKRDAFVHNGGRITKSLQGCKAKLSMVDDEQFVVLPEETNELFDFFKERVLFFTKEAIK